MSIAATLDDLRRDTPGCSVVVFGDLGTRLVLRASSDNHCAQEHYDRICNQAAQVFASCDLVATASGHGQPGATTATVHGEADTTVFVRSAANKADFICCICTPDHAPDGIATKAADLLRDISQEQKCSL